jgi:hypothetical protein
MTKSQFKRFLEDNIDLIHCSSIFEHPFYKDDMDKYKLLLFKKARFMEKEKNQILKKQAIQNHL